MVSLYIAVTDWDWFSYLSSQPELTEVNFWQPGGNRRFSALKPGELFLFKLHSPRNFIVGGGVFTYANLLPTSLAWDAFGDGNGASSVEEMRKRIMRYRRENIDPNADYRIGCILLEDTFFSMNRHGYLYPLHGQNQLFKGSGIRLKMTTDFTCGTKFRHE